MNKRLIIIGAGGHGKVCADIADKIGRYDEILFLDDGTASECLGYKVVGKTNDCEKYVCSSDFFVAIGNAVVRKSIIEKIIALGGCVTTLIHPSAVIGKQVEIGVGSLVVAGAVINPSVKIGKGVIVNTCASVDHDCVVGDYTHIAVGGRVSGTVHIGKNCFFGAGAVIKNNVDVCDDCIIGAGAAVVKNITEKGTYVGVPVRKIK